MGITSSTLARGVGVAAENVAFSPTAQDLARKILLMGNYDETNKTTITEDVAVIITSAADAADKYGFGFQLHRMAIQAERGSGGVQMWACPVAEGAAGVKSTRELTVTVTTAEAGTIPLIVDGEDVPVVVTAGDADSVIATAIAAAVTADVDLPVTAGAALGVATLTSKQASADALDIPVTTGVTLGIQGKEMPGGVSLAIAASAAGADTSDYSTALAALGEGDAANENWNTDCVQGNGQDSTTLGEVLVYVGAGNVALGTYKNTVTRGMKWYLGDTEAGSAGLTTLVTLGGNRKTDRAHLIMPAPGSPTSEVEIACLYAGVCARVNQEDGGRGYGGQILTGLFPGLAADRWTADYDDRATAVAAGIGTSKLENGVLVISDSMSFYHPDSVPVASNGYAEGSHISIIQNIGYNLRLWFEGDRWNAFSVVADVSKVTSVVARRKARDIPFMLGDLTALARTWEGKAWLYSADFTINKLAQGGYVAVRDDGKGFTVTLPLKLSGVGKIIDLTYQFDAKVS